MKPWDLALSEITAATDSAATRLQFVLRHGVPGADTYHLLSFPITGAQHPVDPHVLERVFCHAVLSLVPDNGLAEACQSIAQILEFYRTQIPQPALPPQAVRARRGASFVRPEFPAVEEE